SSPPRRPSDLHFLRTPSLPPVPQDPPAVRGSHQPFQVYLLPFHLRKGGDGQMASSLEGVEKRPFSPDRLIGLRIVDPPDQAKHGIILPAALNRQGPLTDSRQHLVDRQDLR